MALWGTQLKSLFAEDMKQQIGGVMLPSNVVLVASLLCTMCAITPTYGQTGIRQTGTVRPENSPNQETVVANARRDGYTEVIAVHKGHLRSQARAQFTLTLEADRHYAVMSSSSEAADVGWSTDARVPFRQVHRTRR